MKNLKRWSCLLIIFLSVLTISFQSCSKDDAAVAPEENSNINNGNDTNGNNTEGGDGDIKGITLYKVKGEKIVKLKDYTVTGKLLEFQKDVKKILGNMGFGNKDSAINIKILV